MTATLINRSGRCLVFNLPHREVCTDEVCLCSPPAQRRGRPVCSSLTVPAGQTVTALPDAVLAAPEVKAAMGRGDLEVKRKSSKKTTRRSRTKRGRKSRGATS